MNIEYNLTGFIERLDDECAKARREEERQKAGQEAVEQLRNFKHVLTRLLKYFLMKKRFWLFQEDFLDIIRYLEVIELDTKRMDNTHGYELAWSYVSKIYELLRRHPLPEPEEWEIRDNPIDMPVIHGEDYWGDAIECRNAYQRFLLAKSSKSTSTKFERKDEEKHFCQTPGYPLQMPNQGSKPVVTVTTDAYVPDWLSKPSPEDYHFSFDFHFKSKHQQSSVSSQPVNNDDLVPNPLYTPPQQRRPKYYGHRASSHRTQSADLQHRTRNTLGHALTSAPPKTEPAAQEPKSKVYYDRADTGSPKLNATALIGKEEQQYEIIDLTLD